MRADKQSSKSGKGYVGGFLQLFDWNGKSRKKLFPSDSDIPEQSKQKKRSNGNIPRTRLHLMDDDENVASSSIKASSDYSCASSVTDDDISRSRPPGIVARLMGLDTMPTSNLLDPNSTPFFDSQSLGDYPRRNIEFHRDHQVMHSDYLHSRADVPARNAMEVRPQKVINKPIEKFQSEVLPPKSAKSIPITQHKLLSPIKRPNFVSSRNVANIMEATAKIIDSGPQAIATRKVPVVGLSSVTWKVRELKEKVEASQKSLKLAEASQRSVESSAAKYLKGQRANKSCNGPEEATSFGVLSDLEGSSVVLNNSGKSISLALQAKFNVQKREGLNIDGERSLSVEKDHREIMSNQPRKSQSTSQKSTQKTYKKSSSSHSSNVLRQNNQKQNCLVDKGKSPAKPPGSFTSHGRKQLSGDSSLVRKRSAIRSTGSKNVTSSRLGPTNGEKEAPVSSTKGSSRKKRSVDGHFHFEKRQVSEKTLTDENRKSVHSNAPLDTNSIRNEDNKRKGMDVVSFTFTAPLTRLGPGSETRKATEKSGLLPLEYRNKKQLLNLDGGKSSKVASLQYNMVGGDALSSLLEQKLRELTLAVESSQHKLSPDNSSTLILHDSVTASKEVTPGAMVHGQGIHEGKYAGKCGNQSVFGFSHCSQRIGEKARNQVEESSTCSQSGIDARKLLGAQHRSPVSVLEPSNFMESCNSSYTLESCSTEGSELCSSVQAQEIVGPHSSRKFPYAEVHAELSDSDCSSSPVSAFSVKTVPAGWELEYVKEIVCNVELMFNDFALGRAQHIISPRLFYQLETQRLVTLADEVVKPRQKVLFDCVCECLDLRCQHYTCGGFERWLKGQSVMRRNDLLAEEVYREVSGWGGMGDLMVDELVDKDMSGQYGRWLDFEVEAFELGMEIEGQILNSLLDEVVANILPLQ